jgi:predicted metal-dependent hydrolase
MNEKSIQVSGIGEVTLVRKARSKRLRISVKSTGDVLVSIPWLMSFSSGETFVEEKKSWIIRTRLKLEKRGLTKTLLQPGELLSTRKFKYLLLPDSTGKVHVYFRIRLAIEGVLRYEAKRYLPVRTRELADRLGYTINTVTVKNNKTNWGSCSNLKNINLNLHLMRLPDRLIDYILVHELVHTKIPNHGPSFKERLKSHFPDSAELDKTIKKFRPELF